MIMIRRYGRHEEEGTEGTGVNCYLCNVDDPNETHYDPSVHGICMIHAVALWEIASKGIEFDMRDSTVVLRIEEP